MNGQATLNILRCRSCGRQQLPPPEPCASCGDEDFEQKNISTMGVVYSFTVIRIPPARFVESSPYTIVAAKFGEEVTIVGRLLDEAPDGLPIQNIDIGHLVRLVRRDETGCWFRIAITAEDQAGGSS